MAKNKREDELQVDEEFEPRRGLPPVVTGGLAVLAVGMAAVALFAFAGPFLTALPILAAIAPAATTVAGTLGTVGMYGMGVGAAALTGIYVADKVVKSGGKSEVDLHDSGDKDIIKDADNLSPQRGVERGVPEIQAIPPVIEVPVDVGSAAVAVEEDAARKGSHVENLEGGRDRVHVR